MVQLDLFPTSLEQLDEKMTKFIKLRKNNESCLREGFYFIEDRLEASALKKEIQEILTNMRD